MFAGTLRDFLGPRLLGNESPSEIAAMAKEPVEREESITLEERDGAHESRL